MINGDEFVIGESERVTIYTANGMILNAELKIEKMKSGSWYFVLTNYGTYYGLMRYKPENIEII
jgi:hypothetical protein